MPTKAELSFLERVPDSLHRIATSLEVLSSKVGEGRIGDFVHVITVVSDNGVMEEEPEVYLWKGPALDAWTKRIHGYLRNGLEVRDRSGNAITTKDSLDLESELTVQLDDYTLILTWFEIEVSE